jgi:hypothetical protein
VPEAPESSGPARSSLNELTLMGGPSSPVQELSRMALPPPQGGSQDRSRQRRRQRADSREEGRDRDQVTDKGRDQNTYKGREQDEGGDSQEEGEDQEEGGDSHGQVHGGRVDNVLIPQFG